jgi:hypothetical protein
MDQDAGKPEDMPEGQGTVLDRNELLSRLLSRNNTDGTAK